MGDSNNDGSLMSSLHISSTIDQIKRYDLEDRTLEFAKSIRKFLKEIVYSIQNREDGKQLIRSSGSIGANYLEANECISRKDFQYRVKICKKEARETIYWLNLIDIEGSEKSEHDRNILIKECSELMKIFGAIIKNTN